MADGEVRQTDFILYRVSFKPLPIPKRKWWQYIIFWSKPKYRLKINYGDPRIVGTVANPR